MAHQDFMLRMWMIDQLGPDDGDRDWCPEALASDTLDALTFSPAQAADLAEGTCDRALGAQSPCGIGEMGRCAGHATQPSADGPFAVPGLAAAEPAENYAGLPVGQTTQSVPGGSGAARAPDAVAGGS
ncbi:hypothetical protein ACIQ6Y_32975 [Streptomyces sp. NPDC096205]|uniref:hypothetical protein n=1 Tax=Streptomyces sp. NPDC096205 TaxID=3366081 RepID=UPI0038125AE1